MSNHSFIKEVIKEKPLDKRKLLIRIGLLIVAAILFGVIAAVTFAYVRPKIEAGIEARKEPTKIDITGDGEDVTPMAPTKTPTKAPTNTPTPTPTPTPEEKPVESVIPAELGLAEYKKLYQDMKVASQEAEKSIVTVIGIKSTMNYFNDIYDNKGQRSGIVIGNNGRELLVLTDYSVVDGVDRIQVTFSDDKIVDAQYQKHDDNTGLTIIRILLEDVGSDTLEKVVMAPLGNSYKLSQGEPIIALGSPTGYSDSIVFGAITSVTNKVPSWDTEYSVLTTDIIGSEGGSGILTDLDGEIVGIMAQSYSNENNTVTALAISPIRNLIQTLSNNGEIRYLGIRGQEVTADISKSEGLPEGIYIENPRQDSPAMQVGLMSGDIIVKMNDTDVRTMDEYRKQLDGCTIGQPVKLTVMRSSVSGYEEIIFDVIVEAL